MDKSLSDLGPHDCRLYFKQSAAPARSAENRPHYGRLSQKSFVKQQIWLLINLLGLTLR